METARMFWKNKLTETSIGVCSRSYLTINRQFKKAKEGVEDPPK